MRVLRPSELAWARLLLLAFNLFGVATISVSGSGRELRFTGSRLVVGYYVALVWLIGATNYTIVTALYDLFRASLTLFHMLCFFEMIFGSLVSMLILMFHCLRQRASLELCARIDRIRAAGERLGHETGWGLGSTYRCMAGLASFYFAMTIALIGLACADYESLLVMMSSALREFVIIWLLVQYALVVRLLLGIFEAVNRALGQLVRLPGLRKLGEEEEEQPTPDPLAGQLQLLASVHELHGSLLRLCREVVRFYELTVFGCITYVVVCVVVFAYVLVAILVERRSPFPLTFLERLYFVVALICYGSSFVALSRYVTKTIEEIDKTGIIVHQLIRNTRNNEILKELEDFSLYLLHTRIKFTAWGFFEIDGSLVQSIFSSITTYLVIVMQFQLSSASKSQMLNDTTST